MVVIVAGYNCEVYGYTDGDPGNSVNKDGVVDVLVDDSRCCLFVREPCHV